MKEKESCPGVGAPEQQEMEGFGGSTLSAFQHTTFEGPISSLLSPGQENAVPLKHLETITGWDNRTIRRIIEDERRAGVPILPDNVTGYFTAASDEEKARFVSSMRHRAAEILKTAAAIERAQIQED